MEKLPLLPLKNVAVFPELIHALIVGRPASLAAVKAAVESNREVLTVLQKDPNDERPSRDGLYDIGTVATVTRIEQRDGGAQVIVRGRRRVRLHGMAQANDSDDETASYMEVDIESLTLPALPDDTEERAKASALIRDNLETARRIAHLASPQNAQNA